VSHASLIDIYRPLIAHRSWFFATVRDSMGHRER
jgi:hypothetical protein